jgi:hypothetical protein
MSRSPMRALTRATFVAALVALALPGAALAQATRTWVSGTGDDANPCSRTAPCKTFAGAISKTTTNGEIDVIDPGGFGTVTITKSITIDGRGFVSSILGSGTSGVVINAANSKVTLRNLTISGAGTGTNGVRILAAKSVRIQRSDIFSFATGVNDIPSADRGRLVIQDSTIYDNSTAGISVTPTGGASTQARVTVRRTSIDDNGDGIVADGTSARAVLNVLDTAIGDNGSSQGTGIGIHTISNAGVRLSNSEITGNLIGLQADPGSTITSFRNNDVSGNNTDGAPTGTTPQV